MLQTYLNKGMSYNAYRELANALLEQGKVTGPQQSADLTAYGKLNIARMNRLDKTVTLLPETVTTLQQINKTQHWLIITESWCGDAAQILPVLEKMAAQNTLIITAYFLRDEHLPLIDAYLTNGKSRSIPKLIVADDNGKELFNWGPRPKILQQIIDKLVSKQTAFEALKETVHKWYNTDKETEIQKEIIQLLQQFNK